MATRIAVKSPLVEIDGDEMARVMWHEVRDTLILPFVDVELQRFDLALGNRDATDDRITHEAAAAAKRCGVAVKCSTITPDARRVERDGLRRKYPSPNGVIRNELDGTLFREPVLCANVPRLVPHWTEPIVVARHAFGEQYKATELEIDEPGTLRLVFEPESGGATRTRDVFRFASPGVAMGMYNVDDSIRGFAHACLHFGLQRRLPVYFSHKATVLGVYDGRFIDLFGEVFEADFASAYRDAGLTYEPRLIDDMVASSLKWTGGFLWACKNYDGDVQADAVAQGFGSAGLMTSLLMSPDGQHVLSETAHGTVARHYDASMPDREATSNPIATIFAWSRGLAHRGRLDGTPQVEAFASMLEASTIDVVESGCMTGDLARLIAPDYPSVNTAAFIAAVASSLRQRL